MFIKNNKKVSGFTLLELLVVIALIGLLAAIVMASLGTSRKRGDSASIKSTMSSMRGQAELFYANNGSSYGPVHTADYGATSKCGTATTTNLFGSTSVTGSLRNAITSINTKVGSTASTSCAISATSWAFSATLGDSSAWCVDSTGAAQATIINLTTSRCN